MRNRFNGKIFLIDLVGVPLYIYLPSQLALAFSFCFAKASSFNYYEVASESSPDKICSVKNTLHDSEGERLGSSLVTKIRQRVVVEFRRQYENSVHPNLNKPDIFQVTASPCLDHKILQIIPGAILLNSFSVSKHDVEFAKGTDIKVVSQVFLNKVKNKKKYHNAFKENSCSPVRINNEIF